MSRIGLLFSLEYQHYRNLHIALVPHLNARGHEVVPLRAFRIDQAKLAKSNCDIIIAAVDRPNLLRTLRKHGCPVINCSGAIDTPDMPTVRPDDNAIGTLAADTFHQLHVPDWALVSFPCAP